MPVDEQTEPVKKKLKQAQLKLFCKSLPNTSRGSKRKLSDTNQTEGVQVVKVVCKDDISLDKENVLNNELVSPEKSDELIIDDEKDCDDADKTKSVDETLNVTNVSSLELSFNSESGEDVKDVSDTVTPSKKVGKQLTPKLLSAEKRKKKEEMRQEKLLEMQRLKKEKNEAREKVKQERMKKNMELEDLKKKEKEEKERKKQEANRMKEEDRKAKEEEKRKREEEKRKKDEIKDEERKKKEEARILAEKKEAQAKEVFSNFFISKKTRPSEPAKTETTVANLNFMPFQIKPDMRLAPMSRNSLSSDGKNKLDEAVKSQTLEDAEELYLKNLKTGYVPLKTDSTWPLSVELHDVIIIESVKEDCVDLKETKIENQVPRDKRAKLFLFHDNRRPPYWGTWRKKSLCIKSRSPFIKDEKLCDYEVDSDSEWEDEGEGEDLGKEDSDKDEGESDDENVGENGYVLDNTFVPHGYLSEEEADEEEIFNPEDQKLRMKVLKQEFDEEMKLKTERLKPRLLGCVWISNDTADISKGSLYETLMNYRAVWDEYKGPIDPLGPVCEDSPNSSLTSSKSKNFPLPVYEMFLKFVHGNSQSISHLIKDFMLLVERDLPTFYVSKNALVRKLKEIATKTPDTNGKWAVNPDICSSHNMTSLSKPELAVTPTHDTSKNNFMSSYLLKGDSALHSSPQEPVKKRATLITLPRTDQCNTPQLSKKKVPFITLSSSTSSGKHVHVDTPRPLHPFLKKSKTVEVDGEQKPLPPTINLTDSD